jgi:hypothetical protein
MRCRRPCTNAYLEVLGPGFPMDESACESLTKGATSACHKAVSAAAHCWKGVGKSLRKGAKTTCNEQGPEEELCLAGTEANLDGLQSNVDASQTEGHASCDADAVEFRSYCVLGIF